MIKAISMKKWGLNTVKKHLEGMKWKYHEFLVFEDDDNSCSHQGLTVLGDGKNNKLYSMSISENHIVYTLCGQRNPSFQSNNYSKRG